MCASSAPSAVVRGGGVPVAPGQFGRRHQPGQQADRGAFDIAFAAGDLPGEADVRRGLAAAAGGRAASGELRKVLRCSPPSRANSAFSSPGIVRNRRTCSACFSLVWKPTMFHSVPSLLSCRSWTTA